MKSEKIILVTTLLLSMLCLDVCTSAAESAGVNLTPMKQTMPFVSLESLDAEFFPANKVVSIKGSLKNISSSYLRGFLTIFLMSQSGVVLSAFDMPVNDHRPFMDGETVSFDTAVNVSTVSGASRVSVEFTKD